VRRAAAGLVLIAACAQIGEPPGGPQDRAPPVLVAVVPESTLVLPGFDDDVEFRFDETVNEGSQPNFGLGTGDLERLILVSPTENVPAVRWRRSRITVRPKEGWRPNRVYRVELLGGIADLRNNRSRAGTVVTFTTGAPLPTDVLTGLVVDWTTAQPVPQALVEAILDPDSLVYRTTTDSTGRFELGPLPDGSYLVGGVLDQNRNRRRDPREPFDTIRVLAGFDTVGELWVFRRDTVPPRIQALAANDSLSIAVTFNQDLNPYQALPAESAQVRLLPDSTPVPVTAVLTKEAYDSVSAQRPTPAAATPAQPPPAPPPPAARPGDRRDTTVRGRPPGPLTTKPRLFNRLVIRLGAALVPGSRYAVAIRGVENVSRVAGEAILGFQVPDRPAPRPDSARADSAARRPPDSTRPPGDPIPDHATPSAECRVPSAQP
jgi:hypothetical protein